jgi:hypothetical protein
MTDAQWIYSRFIASIPGDPPRSVAAWAEQHVKLPGSARTESFRADITPWCIDPLEAGNRPGIRKITFVKPIQAGGSSAVGEVLLCFWPAHWAGGSIAYFWPNGQASEARWKKNTERVLAACKPLQDKLPADNRHAWIDGLIRFNHLNLEMKGANTPRAVASDSLRAIICEELHDVDGGWEPGRLEQAMGRLTAFWNSIAVIISNAGRKGSELHQSYENGTRRQWMVKCPGCQQYHVMRTRWDKERPDLGGLRYELPEDRKSGDEIDYQRVATTARYQMPCGYIVRNDVTERRALSLSGRYSEPTNPKALPGEESYTLEGVAIDYIDWTRLIRQKHLALRSKKLGDPKPWLDYLRERECAFIGLDDRRPEATPIVLSSRKKDRAGLPDRVWRLCFWDYQKGIKDLGESPHFWGVIWDVDAAGNVLIVFEGKADSEGDVLDVVRRHDVKPICVGVDASFTGEDRYIYAFCLRYGFNAIKVHGQKTGERLFTHEDGVRHAWSEPEPLWPHSANQPGPTKENPDEEPEFWNISQSGAMDALAYLMARKRPKADNPKEDESCFEVPADVSEDFKLHFRAWTREKYRQAATNALEERWRKISEKAPDHMYMCCAYLALWCEMAGAFFRDPPPEPESGGNTALDAPLIEA